MDKKHEVKSTPLIKVNTDSAEGLVTHLITVFGILDEGGDISHPGSFTKTIAERAGKIRILDMHRHDSIMSVLGKPIKIWEIGRAELPNDVLAKWPEATGGVMAVTKFFLDTPEGKGAFIRIAEGAVNEFSYTYDALDTDYSKAINKDGKEVTARNLRSIRLWEAGPVLWGMNEATGVVDVKSAPGETSLGGAEGKPYEVRKVGDEYCVYKVDGGESLGCHLSEDEANAQVAAIHANEGKAVKYSDDQERDDHGRFAGAGGGGGGGGDDEGDGSGEGGSRTGTGYDAVGGGSGSLSTAANVADRWMSDQGKVPDEIRGRDVVQAAGGKEGVNSYLDAAGVERSQENVADRLFAVATSMEDRMSEEHEEFVGAVDNANGPGGIWGWIDNHYDEDASFNKGRYMTDRRRKAGRVLAQRNVERITAAVEALAAALSEMGVRIEVRTATEPAAPNGLPDEVKAGSKETSPTSDEVERLRRQLEVDIAELEID